MPKGRSVAAKTTGGTTSSSTGTSVSENAEDEVSQPLADTGKNNLLPTIIVLSIVIGCVAIVSISKKTA